jgi:hypothetical protein
MNVFPCPIFDREGISDEAVVFSQHDRVLSAESLHRNGANAFQNPLGLSCHSTNSTDQAFACIHLFQCKPLLSPDYPLIHPGTDYLLESTA